MRWLAIGLALLALAGCSASHESASTESAGTTEVDAPRAYTVLMSQLRSYEVASGETCERGVGVDVPSIILPLPPGIRADLRDDTVVVEWSFERILGDCPPTRIVLSVESASREVVPYTTRIDVHEASGSAELRLTDSSRTASVLRAETESADGTRSRPAAVLIRRQT